ncbi:PDZ domain-containing protein [Streptomyces sp. NPDC005551]|uniref:PDZ domain-containing protein n=1 Tax=unclassified Streptomyces TaxID=2593676 RepID=UPI0033EAB562
MEQTALRPKPMPGREPGDARPSDGHRETGGDREPGGTGEPGGVRMPGGPSRRPHTAWRRGRRLMTLLLGLFVGAALVLSGVGLGTVGATVIGMSKLADLRKQTGTGAPGAPGPSARPGTPGESRTLGQGSPKQSGESGRPGRPDRLGKGTGHQPSVGSASAPSKPASSRAASGPGAAAGSGTAASGSGTAAPAQKPVSATLGVEAVDAPRGGALVVGVHVPGPGYTAGLVRGDVLVGFGTARVRSADGLARAVAVARPGSPVTVTVRRADGARQRLSATPGVVT